MRHKLKIDYVLNLEEHNFAFYFFNLIFGKIEFVLFYLNAIN